MDCISHEGLDLSVCYLRLTLKVKQRGLRVTALTPPQLGDYHTMWKTLALSMLTVAVIYGVVLVGVWHGLNRNCHIVITRGVN